MDYYAKHAEKFNVRNVDLIEDALNFHERKLKLVELAKSSEEIEHSRIVNKIIKSIEGKWKG